MRFLQRETDPGGHPAPASAKNIYKSMLARHLKQLSCSPVRTQDGERKRLQLWRIGRRVSLQDNLVCKRRRSPWTGHRIPHPTIDGLLLSAWHSHRRSRAHLHSREDLCRLTMERPQIFLALLDQMDDEEVRHHLLLAPNRIRHTFYEGNVWAVASSSWLPSQRPKADQPELPEVRSTEIWINRALPEPVQPIVQSNRG